ncbi:MAG: anhydro-N-acetylmuramic acid kinase [Alphaproteobacteria bacterium]|nr:anhydro-N-acetylmuramic acid kinase [Alphaproteobacteria bacterium]
MRKYTIIGNMTGNSMDAVDLVCTTFEGNKMQDICSFSKPYDKEMQSRIEWLRRQVFNKTRAEIESISEFEAIHNDYISQIASCIEEMCTQHHLDKNKIDAIGFHGKTLDHNPPSKASQNGTLPYTLQIGSGQMLADLTSIPVVYDFRSDPLMAGFDGAPLVPPHNAHIAATDGDGCYYNGGNTSNFAIIQNGKALIGADAGPCNEYVDNYIRERTALSFDKDGFIGKYGKIDEDLLQTLFTVGRNFYQTPLPKSGDPAYYHRKKVFNYVARRDIVLEDAVRTFEYFAAYIAVQALTLLPADIPVPQNFILFGGGWKNPIVRESFEHLLSGSGYVLPEHQNTFESLKRRFKQKPQVRYSQFGEYMEARLFADLARYKLENKAWEIPEIVQAGQNIVCGRLAVPAEKKRSYDDKINRAAKGWQ